jgi:hypothetical protein
LEVGPKRRIVLFESLYQQAKVGEFLATRRSCFVFFELGAFDLNWKSIGVLEKY